MAATISGTGCCTGLGSCSGSASLRRTSVTADSRASVRSANGSHGRFASSCSLFTYPAPIPSSARPSDSRSSVATSRASSAGFQKPTFSTYVRNRSRLLIAPAATRTVNGPATPRWSGAAKMSNPSWSVRRTTRSNSAADAAPWNATPNWISAMTSWLSGAAAAAAASATGATVRGVWSGVDGRESLGPGRRILKLAGHPDQHVLTAVSGYELHADRQPVRRPMQRQADGGLAGHVELRSVGDEARDPPPLVLRPEGGEPAELGR